MQDELYDYDLPVIETGLPARTTSSAVQEKLRVLGVLGGEGD